MPNGEGKFAFAGRRPKAPGEINTAAEPVGCWQHRERREKPWLNARVR